MKPRVLIICVDITEHRRMEEHLLRTQRMDSMGTFSSGIAHDFNNLLTVIKGYGHLAHADAEGNPAVRESVDQINKAAARASLVGQLLDFNRQRSLQPRAINLNDAVSHFRKMLDRIIGTTFRIYLRLLEKIKEVLAPANESPANGPELFEHQSKPSPFCWSFSRSDVDSNRSSSLLPRCTSDRNTSRNVVRIWHELDR